LDVGAVFHGSTLPDIVDKRLAIGIAIIEHQLRQARTKLRIVGQQLGQPYTGSDVSKRGGDGPMLSVANDVVRIVLLSLGIPSVIRVAGMEAETGDNVVVVVTFELYCLESAETLEWDWRIFKCRDPG
jgi:hypothetical protein